MSARRRALSRAGVVAAIVAAIAATATACSILGVNVNHQLSTEGNLANQKKVAQAFVRDYPHPDLQSVRFTDEGSVLGSGSWSANAIVTVSGRDYDEILGTYASAGDELPPAPLSENHGDVTVIYSDGTSEALR